MFKEKYYKTRDKANYYARKLKGEVYHYSPKSKTKFDYEIHLTKREGYFDENFAAEYPYCVSYLEEEEGS